MSNSCEDVLHPNREPRPPTEKRAGLRLLEAGQQRCDALDCAWLQQIYGLAVCLDLESRRIDDKLSANHRRCLASGSWIMGHLLSFSCCCVLALQMICLLINQHLISCTSQEESQSEKQTQKREASKQASKLVHKTPSRGIRCSSLLLLQTSISSFS